MSDEGVIHQAPAAVLPSKARAAFVAQALSEAARRARFSTRRRRSLTASGFRAQRRGRLFSLLRALAFLCLVVLPTGTAALYYGFVASDQYVAEARFTVRGGLPPTMDRIGTLTGAPSVLIIQDTQVIMNYLQSRSVVEGLDRSVGLQALFGRPEIDWLSRLKRGQPIEKIVRYWKSHIDLGVQMPSGIVVFSVRAFTAGDAVKLADAALDASEQLVNRMNDQMRDDAVALADVERQRAQDSLVKARNALERIRNEEGVLNADSAAKSLSELITIVKGETLRMRQQYEAQRRFVDADAPQLQNLQARLAAGDLEVSKLEGRMTRTREVAGGGDPKALSGSMSRLDEAGLETTIAEKIYAGSLAAFEHARLAGETKLMYINTFVHPVAAEESKYPRRVLFVSLVALAGFAAWGLVAGLLVLARNRLA